MALAEASFGSGLGIRADMEGSDVDLDSALFAESHSRFIVSVSPRNAPAFEKLMENDCAFLGEVTGSDRLVLSWGIERIVDVALGELLSSWREGLRGML